MAGPGQHANQMLSYALFLVGISEDCCLWNMVVNVCWEHPDLYLMYAVKPLHVKKNTYIITADTITLEEEKYCLLQRHWELNIHNTIEGLIQEHYEPKEHTTSCI
jgi:hypothetical protein